MAGDDDIVDLGWGSMRDPLRHEDDEPTKTVSSQIFDALKSSPEPMKQIEAVLQVSKDIAANIRACQTIGGNHDDHKA